MTQWFDMKGKVVIVTGGSGGLGSVMADALVSVHATVVIADVVEPHTNRQGCSFVHCDLARTDHIRAMMEETARRHGGIDVLINCAVYGAGYGPEGSLDKLSDEDWQRGLDGAVGTAFRCTREAIPYLERRGGGSIVNISSIHGMTVVDPNLFGDSGLNTPANYSAGKSAVIQLTRYSAAHLADKGIRVNCIIPGSFPNEREQEDTELIDKLSKQTLLGRVGKPKELAGAVLLLASDASSYMTGSSIVVDGGWTSW